jgi:myo-inositol-1-phosphate synthase
MTTLRKETPMRHGKRVGVWLAGARGSVATTVIAGAAALGGGLAPPVGCVTERPGLRELPLPAFDALVFGGHDIVGTPLPKRAEALAEAGVLPGRLLRLVAGELEAADRDVVTAAGPALDGEAAPQAVLAAELAADITAFRKRHDLETVVVVNLSSTEEVPADREEFHTLDGLRRALETEPAVLPASALYAYAAFTAGCSFVDFTPSTGARLPALRELAEQRGLPYTGRDGKTGETLVKSALAPMFVHRALRVRSWSGTNLLGGGDGATLERPEAALSKTESKTRVLDEILGDGVEGTVHIDNVPALGEWKTAWDHISFEGFLGVPMTMQFTWQGCDSALAAPLVLDLVRLMALAVEAGDSGPQEQFGFFFKDPEGSADPSLDAQYRLLVDWAGRVSSP